MENDQMPIDQEIEHLFLGCLLAEPSCFNGVAWFNSSFFGVELHGKIFDVIKHFHKIGREYCPESIAQFFSADPALPEIGGATFLKDLANGVISPPAQAVRGYANHLLSLHYRRMVLFVATGMKTLALDCSIDTPPERLLDNIEGIIAEARNIRTADNFVSAADGIIGALEMSKNPQFGIHSGFHALHKITGGFKPSELITIGGRPGMGKTAIGLTFAVNAAVAGKRVLFFSLEMPCHGLWQRIISRFSKVPVHSGGVYPDEWPDIEKSVSGLHSMPLTIDDSSGLTALDICARAAQFKRKNGLDMVVVDYLGFVKAADPRANKVHQIEEITQSLKGLAKALKVPVLLLCQLNRAVDGKDDKRPGLSDLRDSGAIEQDSDVVMFIYRDDYYPKRDNGKLKTEEAERYSLADAEAKKGTAELIVAKNRQNVLATIDLKFNGQRQEFFE